LYHHGKPGARFGHDSVTSPGRLVVLDQLRGMSVGEIQS
jgi:hypothetical protein